MRLPMFNSFAEDVHGKANVGWGNSRPRSARLRLTQLASVNSGEYFIFDLRAKQIVGSVESTKEEVTQTREREF
jgi:hypothetical protein